jgi:DNA polymerase I-like protein with 3'-5' exonuclease and polymerase domains
LELEKTIKKNKWKSFINGQIHDEGILDIIPEEKQDIINEVQYICSDKLPKQFTFVNIPILMEFAITPIGTSWYDKEEIK